MPNFLTTARTDGALVRAVVDRRDEKSFRTLYRRHTPRLFLFALRLSGGNEADAEDVVQETWVRACDRLAGFRWESAFSTWLCGIGLNVAREFIRRRSRSPIDASDDPPDVPARRVNLDERVDLEAAVASLPDGARVVLVLHDIEGMKHGEIAERLDISEGTSKSQLHDARRALRAALGTEQEKNNEG